jgi:hypothetical protein
VVPLIAAAVGLVPAAARGEALACPARQEGPPEPSLARLEPARGVYFGVSLDWGTDSAAAFNQRLGAPAAVYVQFLRLPLEGDDLAYLEGFVEQVAAQGGMGLLTLEPVVPLEAITPELAAGLAEQLALHNRRGVPLLVRFAHEMNGSWYPWGQQPDAYVRAFRAIAAAVHAHGDRTAMLWAPTYGGGYPFRGGRYEARPGTADFARLDTNGDGQLDQRDDMYAPYYPGDDAVDWVGMTVYHWGDHWPWGKNVAPEPGKFAAQISGAYAGAGGDDTMLPDFYRVYAEERGKPMAIPETAALYNTTVGGDAELEIKRLWWRQVLGEQVARDFPRIKLINWFEWRKPEGEVGGAVVDWTVTTDPVMARLFFDDLPAGRFLFATDLAAADPAAAVAPRP